MTIDEAQKAFAEIKKMGGSDQDILQTIYYTYQKGDINLEGLQALAKVLGYDVTSEFLAMNTYNNKPNG